MNNRTGKQSLVRNRRGQFLKAETSEMHASVQEKVTEFILDRTVQNISENTVEWYKVGAKKFEAVCAKHGVSDLALVNARVLRRFLDELESLGHNSGGRNHIYRAVRVFLGWCADEYGLLNLREAMERVPCPDPYTEPLDPIPNTSVRKMLNACRGGEEFTNLRDYALLLVLLDTGVRHEELKHMEWKDVDLANGRIEIRRGKGGKRRTVFVGNRTKRALRAYLVAWGAPMLEHRRKRLHAQDTDAVWVTQDGGPITKAGIRQIVRRRAETARVPVPGLHDFRRTFAVNSLRNGMDVITLQKLLGHADLSIINRYLKLVTDDLANAHKKYGVVDNLK